MIEVKKVDRKYLLQGNIGASLIFAIEKFKKLLYLSLIFAVEIIQKIVIFFIQFLIN
jgi:hypothetical protein